MKFGKDNECSEISSSVCEIGNALDVNVCAGNSVSKVGGKCVGDVKFSDLENIACKCLTFNYNKKELSIFSGKFCEIDEREQIIAKYDFCLSSKGNEATLEISKNGEVTLKCICRNNYSYDIENNTCIPPKLCGRTSIWTSVIKHSEVCSCPKLKYQSEEISLLNGTTCSDEVGKNEIQKFCEITGLCMMDTENKTGNSCDVNLSYLEDSISYYEYEKYEKIISCKCNQKYYDLINGKCVEKSIKDLCNSIDPKLADAYMRNSWETGNTFHWEAPRL